MERKPDCEALLNDWIHEAAFRGNTLGFSKYCKTSDTGKITNKHIYSYLSQYFTPNRLVVSGVGVDHSQLVELSKKLFDVNRTIWAKQPNLLFDKLPPVDHSLAQYTGGEFKVS
jgi:processing peptidase subunit alpha